MSDGRVAALQLAVAAADGARAMPPYGPTAVVAAPSPAALWRQYRSSGDVRLRDRLLFTLAPLVRVAGAREAGDATAGLSALAYAIEAYAPERDGALEDFAWGYVRRALTSSA